MKASEDSPGQFSTAAQGTIQLIVARVVFMACGYVASVVLARELGPASFGTYGIVMSLLLWLEVLGGLGVPRAAGKLIAQAADPGSLIEATFSALLMVGCLLLAVCWLAAPFVATYFGIPDGALLLRLAVIDLPFNAVYIAYHAVMIGQQRFRAMSLAIVAYGVTKLAGTLLLFWIGFSVEAALIANVLATVGGVAYLMPRFGLRLSWPNRDALRPIIALSAPIAVLVVTMQLLLSAHLWILKRIGTGSADTLGHYIAALNVAQLPSIVPAALGVVVLSSVALALGRQDAALARRHAASACRFVLLTLAPVCVLGAQQATAIMQLLYSEAYRAGGLYLGILLGGYGLFALLDTMVGSPGTELEFAL